MIQGIITDREMLNCISEPVTKLDDPAELAKLFKDLEDTVNARHGKLTVAGLAAVQIGVLKRIVIIKLRSVQKPHYDQS